ncbi:hypothetical protein BE18_02835 [Sorangium cellulosum]|uniref:Uncharacterized protein n=1 Tax=Sorangium cellulosum TaxID=56 RepID=A0A150SK59_SORCE|nr:hypothetical protein BE18_02835 [Sorangium cellulosum]
MELSWQEQSLMKPLTRVRTLFGFLRLHRHELFDEAFQEQLESKPWGQRARSPDSFSKRHFKVDLRAKTITCPAGQVEVSEPGDTVDIAARKGHSARYLGTRRNLFAGRRARSVEALLVTTI